MLEIHVNGLVSFLNGLCHGANKCNFILKDLFGSFSETSQYRSMKNEILIIFLQQKG